MPRIFLIKPRNKPPKRSVSNDVAGEPDDEDFVKADQIGEKDENDCAMDDKEENEPLDNKSSGQPDSIEAKRNSIESSTSDDIIPSDTSSIPGTICYAKFYLESKVGFIFVN